MEDVFVNHMPVEEGFREFFKVVCNGFPRTDSILKRPESK